MENPQYNTVSSEQGSETPEYQELELKNALKMLERDLTTARVLCQIVGTDDNVAQAVVNHLQQKMPHVTDLEGIKKDARICSALFGLQLESKYMLSQMAEIICGLHSNIVNQIKNAKKVL